MKEYTLAEVRELMAREGKSADNWVQFCAFVNRNFIVVID